MPRATAAEMENERFGRGVGSQRRERLKAGVRGDVDDAAPATFFHPCANQVGERDKRLYVNLDFGLFLLRLVR